MLRKIIKRIYCIIHKYFFDRLIYSIGENTLSIKRRHYPSVTDLWEVDQRVFSQWGEDGIIDYIFWSLNIYKPRFVEIGTEDYRESNTRFLFERTGAAGLIIDSESNLKSLVSRTVDMWKGELSIVSSFVTRENINSILDNYGFLSGVDLFSLDIDGVDYWILRAIQFEQFKCIIVEYNAYFGSEHSITVPYLENFNRTEYHYSNLCFGASLRALIDLIVPRGFVFIGTNLRCSNAFFVRKDLVNQLSLTSQVCDDLSKYTENYIRESLREDGELSYVDAKNRGDLIANCEVYDLDREKLFKFGNLGKPHSDNPDAHK